ncbi:MAG: Fe-S cluster assembly protein SufD [Gammaproteobacteria bacterium]|nr:Fe-S cluster assembly protein SufD [Gammaproteobacteria bacterium]
MSTTHNYIQESIELSEALENNSPTAWLSDFRKMQRIKLEGATVPTRTTEHFKYNNLTALNQGGLAKFPESPAVSAELPSLVSSLEGDTIVLIDGRFDSSSSKISGSHLVAFHEANEDQQKTIKDALSRQNFAKNIFNRVNAGLTHSGWLVEFNKSVDYRPLHIVHITTQAAVDSVINEQLIVKLNSMAEATVIEHFVSDNNIKSGKTISHQSAHFDIGDAANLQHYRLHLEHSAHIHFGQCTFWLNRDSQLNSFHLATGGIIKRIDLDVIHQSNGSHAEINGVYLAADKQQVDYHTNVEHRTPHCTTQEVFRGLIGGEAKAVFNGRIHIYPDAQKTLAELSNKNLLLSNKAEIDTKPELEIYADDVRCAHGATISQMDSTAMFYLTSRGIPKEKAKLMLSFGFVNELINNINNDAIVDYLQPLLTQFFKQTVTE